MTTRHIPSVDTLSVVGTRCQLHTSPVPPAAGVVVASGTAETAAAAAAAVPLVTLESGVEVDRHDVRCFVDAATLASWARRKEPALPTDGRPLPEDYRFFGAAAEEEEEEGETEGGASGVRWLRGGRTADDRMDAAALCALAARLATRPLRRQRMGLVSAAKRRRRVHDVPVAAAAKAAA
eukprot:Rhum_TRINITY_DN14637_c36_g1::Rhum_TRINITY_DN14637_c36_g1_i1::g.102810::m.102810